jgi:hypothetical protein
LSDFAPFFYAIILSMQELKGLSEKEVLELRKKFG